MPKTGQGGRFLRNPILEIEKRDFSGQAPAASLHILEPTCFRNRMSQAAPGHVPRAVRLPIAPSPFQCPDHRIMEDRTERDDAEIFSRGVNAIGEQDDGKLLLRIDPD